jgi:hypothetical protein
MTPMLLRIGVYIGAPNRRCAFSKPAVNAASP